MPELTELSPAVSAVLEENHFEPVKVLRYGPRFVCIEVRSGERTGLFKMVLPESERNLKDYEWTWHDGVEELEKRLLKEALFLQFFSQQLGVHGFEPQIIALSETTPVWSVRTFINERSMSAWESNFVFSPRFYKAVEPKRVVEFFDALHRLSDDMPATLADMIGGYQSALLLEGRYDYTAETARLFGPFPEEADRLVEAFARHRADYAKYKKVVTHYEPYSCHIFLKDGKMSLIDWENVGWGHPLQDLSILWVRVFDRPEWQQEFERQIRKKGYFKGLGRLYWESELLIQCYAMTRYIKKYGPLSSEDYDRRALAFFEETIREILTSSPYFKA